MPLFFFVFVISLLILVSKKNHPKITPTSPYDVTHCRLHIEKNDYKNVTGTKTNIEFLYIFTTFSFESLSLFSLLTLLLLSFVQFSSSLNLKYINIITNLLKCDKSKNKKTKQNHVHIASFLPLIHSYL